MDGGPRQRSPQTLTVTSVPSWLTVTRSMVPFGCGGAVLVVVVAPGLACVGESFETAVTIATTIALTAAMAAAAATPYLAIFAAVTVSLSAIRKVYVNPARLLRERNLMQLIAYSTIEY